MDDQPASEGGAASVPTPGAPPPAPVESPSPVVGAAGPVSTEPFAHPAQLLTDTQIEPVGDVEMPTHPPAEPPMGATRHVLYGPQNEPVPVVRGRVDASTRGGTEPVVGVVSNSLRWMTDEQLRILRDGSTADDLYHAVLADDPHTIALCLQTAPVGPEFVKMGDRGNAVAHVLVRHDMVALMRDLAPHFTAHLEALHCEDRLGNTAFHHACAAATPAMTVAMLQIDGIDTTRVNSLNQTALHFAVAHAACDAHAAAMVQVLMAVDAIAVVAGIVDREAGTALHTAAKRGYVDAAAALLTGGADANATNHRGATPMHLAAVADDSDMVNLLLRHGAEKEAKDKRGRTPLFCAAFLGKPEAVQTLVDAKADVNALNPDGYTPVEAAAAKPTAAHHRSAEILHRAGSRFDHDTPAQACCRQIIDNKNDLNGSCVCLKPCAEDLGCIHKRRHKRPLEPVFYP